MIKEAVLAAVEELLAPALRLERAHFRACFALADQREGMAAFLEKRVPRWRSSRVSFDSSVCCKSSRWRMHAEGIGSRWRMWRIGSH
jgi:hypothetical protein